MTKLKVIAATATIIGIILAFLERWFAPSRLLLEDSPNYPDWLSWAGLVLTSFSALAYIAFDLLDRK